MRYPSSSRPHSVRPEHDDLYQKPTHDNSPAPADRPLGAHD
ncbi:MAG: hypothetical protein U0441_21490 [Polyangiaceae bacterium]